MTTLEQAQAIETNNTLIIGYKHFYTNEDDSITIKASNVDVLVRKYNEALDSDYMMVHSFHLTNSIRDEKCGTHMNAGAFLHGLLKDMLGREID